MGKGRRAREEGREEYINVWVRKKRRWERERGKICMRWGRKETVGERVKM